MMKKRVPEWLNSSIWSTTPSREDDRVFQNNDSTATTSASTSKSTADVMIQPPVPVPPPAVTRKDPSPPPQPVPTPQKPETKDPRESKSNGDDDGNGGYVGPSSDDISRQTQFLAELSKKVINIKELRRIASQGVPDTAGIRSAVWKLLLGYLPPDRSLWSSEMSKKRSQYKQFKDELLMNPSEVARRLEKSKGDDNNEVKSETRGILSRSELTHEEHPLSLGKQSVWNKFFQIEI